MFPVHDTNLFIQAHWRGRVMRNEFLDIKKKTIIVQSYFRMQKALKEYKIISDQRQVAAILIQSWVRRFLAGKKYQKLKQDVHDRYQISVQLHQRAAAVIQAAWRSHRFRLAFKEAYKPAQYVTDKHCNICDMDFESTPKTFQHIMKDHFDVALGCEDGNERWVF